MIVITVLLLLFITIYFLLKYKYEYWKRRGVPGPEPRLIVGNVGSVLLTKRSLPDVITNVYNEYNKTAVVGIFKGLAPALIVREPDLIKDVMIKDFAYFHDNDVDVDKSRDPLLGRNPFVLKGEEWKTVRTLLTPCFTSGKMKSIFPLLRELSDEFVKFIKKQSANHPKDGLEAKNLSKSYTLNTVASCAFGLDGKCFENTNSEFEQIADKFLSPGGWTSIVLVLTTVLPSLVKLLRVKFVLKDVENHLIGLTTETVNYRREHNIERNDFIQIVSKLKETSKDYKFTDIDVCAQAASFFVDGYETSATTLSFLLFHLADNPQVQDKLREEIDEQFQRNNGTLTYESIQQMAYLDAVFCESMRIDPPAQFLFKRCTRNYKYTPKPNDGLEKPLEIERGTTILIPIKGLHRDPKYFDNPTVFNPERFLGNNKENIQKYTFFPFGEGPRACLGQRFGILQVKTATAYIIRNFKLTVNAKTQKPIKLDPLFLLPAPIGGFWIDFKERQL